MIIFMKHSTQDIIQLHLELPFQKMDKLPVEAQ